MHPNRLKKQRQTHPPLKEQQGSQQGSEQGDEDNTHPHPRVESAISKIGPVAEAIIIDSSGRSYLQQYRRLERQAVNFIHTHTPTPSHSTCFHPPYRIYSSLRGSFFPNQTAFIELR